MHLGHTWFPPSKARGRVCYYCRGMTHIIALFPTSPIVYEAPRGEKHLVALLTVIIQHSDRNIQSVIAALTTGAAGNIIDEDLTQ